MRLKISRFQQVADRILDLAKFLLIRGLFIFCVIAYSRAAFFRVTASVCDAQLRICVNFDIGIKNKLRIQFSQIGLIQSQKYLL